MHADLIPAYRASDLIMRYPNVDPDGDIRIREGWLQLVEELLIELKYLFPEVRVLAISSLSWLTVTCDGEGLLDLQSRKRLHEVIQGFVTRSLSTCEHCGSQRSVRQWEATSFGTRLLGLNHKLDRTICEECVPAQNHAAARCVAGRGVTDVVH